MQAEFQPSPGNHPFLYLQFIQLKTHHKPYKKPITMKQSFYFHIFITVMFAFLYTSCEKAEIQRNPLADQIPIESREVENCNECPLGDCCCAVWLQDPVFGYANLFLCGTSDGNQLCSGEATGDCDEFSGGGQALELIGGGVFRRGFCVNPGGPFWISNLSGSPAYIYVTCQYDLSGPQTLTITIPGTSRVYIGSNGECEIDYCL
jgi:hypothetical protein